MFVSPSFHSQDAWTLSVSLVARCWARKIQGAHMQSGKSLTWTNLCVVHFFTDIPVRNSCKWVFPKIMVPPKSSISIGFSNGFPLFAPSILGYLYFWKHPVVNQALFPRFPHRNARLLFAMWRSEFKSWQMPCMKNNGSIEMRYWTWTLVRCWRCVWWTKMLQNLHEMQCFSFNHPKWNLVHKITLLKTPNH